MRMDGVGCQTSSISNHISVCCLIAVQTTSAAAGCIGTTAHALVQPSHITTTCLGLSYDPSVRLMSRWHILLWIGTSILNTEATNGQVLDIHPDPHPGQVPPSSPTLTPRPRAPVAPSISVQICLSVCLPRWAYRYLPLRTLLDHHIAPIRD